MKQNLIYILTLVTIVIALNYLHADPYPELNQESDAPFFVYTVKNSPEMQTSVPATSDCPECQETQHE